MLRLIIYFILEEAVIHYSKMYLFKVGKMVADDTTLLGANLRQISAHGHCVGAKWGLILTIGH